MDNRLQELFGDLEDPDSEMVQGFGPDSSAGERTMRASKVSDLLRMLIEGGSMTAGKEQFQDPEKMENTARRLGQPQRDQLVADLMADLQAREKAQQEAEMLHQQRQRGQQDTRDKIEIGY